MIDVGCKIKYHPFLNHIVSIIFKVTVSGQPSATNMKYIVTAAALATLCELSQATVYLAGDSTMARNGANDGVTDGKSCNTQKHILYF